MFQRLILLQRLSGILNQPVLLVSVFLMVGLKISLTNTVPLRHHC